MARPTIDELRDERLEAMSDSERAVFDEALAAARLALQVGEMVRDAREAAGCLSENWQLACPRARRRSPASKPAVPAPRSAPSRRPQQHST